MSPVTQKRILIATNDPALFKLLSSVLTTEGYQVTQTLSGAEAFDKAANQRPHMVIIDDSLPGVDAPGLCRRLRKNTATHYLAILVLSSKTDVANMIAALEAGADEYLAKPFDSKELAFRVRNVLVRVEVPAGVQVEPGKRGQIIAVFGTKGGVGKTMVAVNTAVALQRRSGGRVLIFDADFFFGDVGAHLNMPPTHSVSELTEHIDELDPGLVDQVVLRHSCGIHVLLSPFSPEKAELVTPEHIKRLLTYLAGTYDYVIVDCHAAYDDRTLAILERADDIMLVVTPEVGPIKNTSVFLGIAGRLGLSLDKIHIILNRANSYVGINVREIERSFKHRVQFSIVSGGRPVVLSVNHGQPLTLVKSDHPVSKEIFRIADWLIKNTPQS